MASIARNTAYLTVAKSLNVAIYALFGLLLPKFVPLEINGLYTLMNNLLFFGSMAATFGIPLVLVRGIAQDKSRTAEIFTDAHMAMVGGALLAGLLIEGYVALEMQLQGTFESGRLLMAGIVWLVLFADAYGASGEGLFQAHEQMTFPAAVEAATGMAKVGGGLLALWLLPDETALFGVYAAFAAASGMRAIVLTPRARREFVSGDLPARTVGQAFAMFKQSVGVALFRMLRMVRNRVDLFLIGLLIPAGALGLMEAGDLARGLYGQAFRVVLVFHTLTLAFNTAIFPSMVRMAGEGDRASARERFFRAMSYQAWWAAPLAAVTFIYGHHIAGWFGLEYRYGFEGIAGTTGEVLRVLVFATLLDSIGGPVGMVVLGDKKLDKYLPLLGGALAVTSITLNLIWIPQYGIIGAAYACLAASGVEIILKVFLVRSLLGSPAAMLTRTAPYLLLAGVLGLVLAYTPLDEHPILGGLAMAVVYAVLTLKLGLVDPAVRSRLARAMKRA